MRGKFALMHGTRVVLYGARVLFFLVSCGFLVYECIYGVTPFDLEVLEQRQGSFKTLSRAEHAYHLSRVYHEFITNYSGIWGHARV